MNRARSRAAERRLTVRRCEAERGMMPLPARVLTIYKGRIRARQGPAILSN